MAKQKQDDQVALTYSSYVRTQDVTLKICQRRWIIGRSGERGSRISVMAARHDDDDDDDDDDDFIHLNVVILYGWNKFTMEIKNWILFRLILWKNWFSSVPEIRCIFNLEFIIYLIAVNTEHSVGYSYSPWIIISWFNPETIYLGLYIWEDLVKHTAMRQCWFM